MTSLISVALGGAVGAVLRFLVGLLVAFPFGTLTVNVVGSFTIAMLWVLLTARGLQHWMPFLMVGVMGGFTTFSTFSLDTMRLLEEGKLAAAGGYVVASVAFSLIACAVGIWLARGMTT